MTNCSPRRPWWSVDEAASRLGLSTADLREAGSLGLGPRYTETDGVRAYRPADVRLWARTGWVRDHRGWNREAP
ncbi:hypothetical protein ACIA8O_00410 [Kitasatospora sp. NPDC051853]|uniref:hypothetical protein n=1 Tax=Kitasatospora sp. NPDC051853 TaxID=3364058 RepID=UPI00379917CD